MGGLLGPSFPKLLVASLRPPPTPLAGVVAPAQTKKKKVTTGIVVPEDSLSTQMAEWTGKEHYLNIRRDWELAVAAFEVSSPTPPTPLGGVVAPAQHSTDEEEEGAGTTTGT